MCILLCLWCTRKRLSGCLHCHLLVNIIIQISNSLYDPDSSLHHYLPVIHRKCNNCHKEDAEECLCEYTFHSLTDFGSHKAWWIRSSSVGTNRPLASLLGEYTKSWLILILWNSSFVPRSADFCFCSCVSPIKTCPKHLSRIYAHALTASLQNQINPFIIIILV